MSYSSYHPGKTEASVMTLSSSLGIPSDPLGSHLWIVAGVAPGSIHRLAELMSADIGLICRLAGISRHTVARKLRIGAPYQSLRVLGYTALYRPSMRHYPSTRTILPRRCHG